MVVKEVRLPEAEVPVTVTGNVPAAAVLLAVKPSTVWPGIGAFTSASVTPLGRPETVRVTTPVNPLPFVTVMVSLALAP